MCVLTGTIALQHKDAHGLSRCRLSVQRCGMQPCWHSLAQTISKGYTPHGSGRGRLTANGRSMTPTATCKWLRELLPLVVILSKVCPCICHVAHAHVTMLATTPAVTCALGLCSLSGPYPACWCQLAGCMHEPVCLPVCLPACLSVCLSILCWSFCLSV